MRRGHQLMLFLFVCNWNQHAASGGWRGKQADADARNQHAASDALVHLHINSCNWNQIEHPPHLPTSPPTQFGSAFECGTFLRWLS